jgi:hypothetical protein
MNRGADIVLKTGQGQLRGPAATTDGRPRLEQAHRPARLRQDDGGGQAVGTSTDYNSINRPISQDR